MGSYDFKWAHQAEEVYVTGTFDNWSKSTKMVKGADNVFSAVVDVPMDKTMYKFVVDGNWTTDSTHRIESDHEGNLNNYILPEDVIPHSSEPTFTTQPIATEASAPGEPHIQSAGADSTTAALAAVVPLEPKRDLAAEEAAKEESTGAGAFTSSAAPESSTAALASEVPLEKSVAEGESAPITGSDETVGISPLPASESATNPTILAPGEPLPATTASVNDNVHLDEESYNKPDASNLGVGAVAATAVASVTGALGYLYNSVAAKHEETKTGGSEIAIPETVKNIIPESALPMTIPGIGNITGATTSSVDDTAAATQTTDTVPEIVKESQIEAGQDPEASASPVAVEEKKEVEDELLSKVPTAPSATSGIAPIENVPEIVQNSQVAAGVAPEASAIRAAVLAKKEVEGELKSEVAPAAAEPTLGSISASLSGPFSSDEPVASDVPDVVKESYDESGMSPEAASNPTAVELKKEVEATLPHTSTSEEAPATAPVTETPVANTPAIADTANTSTTKPVEPPVATSSTATPAHATDPVASSSQSVTSGADAKDKKKKKRISAFFGKVKAALK